jgi:hypothetical protein
MMCYRDRTFCPFHTTCVCGEVCTKALTDDVVTKALKANLLISQYLDKPHCYKERTKNGQAEQGI